MVKEPDLPLVLTAFSLFDGTRTREQVEALIYERHGRPIGLNVLLNVLLKKGLLNVPELTSFNSTQPAFLVIDLTPLARRSRYGHLFAIQFSALCVALLLCSGLALSFITYFFVHTLASNHAVQLAWEAVCIFLLASISAVAHETGHLIASLFLGQGPEQVAVEPRGRFFVTISFKLKGAYRLSRRQRALVSTAGSLLNLSISLLAIVLLLVSGALSGDRFLWYTLYVNLLLAVSNLNPRVSADGYHLLRDVLQATDPQGDADQLITAFRSKNVHALWFDGRLRDQLKRGSLYLLLTYLLFAFQALIFLIAGFLHGLPFVGVLLLSSIYQPILRGSLSLVTWLSAKFQHGSQAPETRLKTP
jgi:Zn-dependent protease